MNVENGRGLTREGTVEPISTNYQAGEQGLERNAFHFPVYTSHVSHAGQATTTISVACPLDAQLLSA